MLSLRQPLPPICFARNVQNIEFVATNAQSGLPYRAVGAVGMIASNLATLQEGETISVSWISADTSSNTIVFTAKATPSVVTDIPLSNWAAIGQKMGAHPRIAPHFTVTNSQYTILPDVKTVAFEANDINPAIRITISHTIQLTPNALWEAVVYSFPATASTMPTNYRVRVNVFFEDVYNSGSWQNVASLELYTEDDGSIRPVDIGAILRRECDRSLTENPFRHYSADTPVIADNVRNYYVEYREMYAGSTTDWQETPVALAMIGGLPDRLFLQENYDFFTSTAPVNAWLTYALNRRVIRLQKNYLSWFNYTSATINVYLRTTIRSYEGVESFEPTLSIAVPAYHTVTFPVNPDALGLLPSAAFYTVEIQRASGAPLNQPLISFFINDAYYRSVRTLGYLNAFGVPETVHATGDFTKSVDFEREKTVGIRQDSALRLVPTARQNRAFHAVTWSYKLGGLNMWESEQLIEVELSRVLFDLTGTLQFALVFKQAKSSLKSITNTSDHLYDREFLTSPKLAINNYGPDRLLFAASVLENVQELRTKTVTTYTPNDPNPNGTPTTDGLIWEELGIIKDTDILLFAKVNAAGNLVGHRWVRSGDYMRHIRGISPNATHHLDGLGYKAENGSVIIKGIDGNTGAEVLL